MSESSFGWMRKNTGRTGRMLRAIASSALVAGSFVIGPKWAKSLAAAAGGALAVEAATGYCFVTAASQRLVQRRASRTQNSL